ncbi:SsgA family sporulation/cell division regulator [Streptomyces chryseus]|uniref:Sporulation and cell division protein SsgA n=1 Tax=Streptomyces chryseus TaxID=68186 RepID=A0ABQ3DLF0_9ACTN|nr:SsgA family sporulation/cell division regulator [Streptomyces chryseus]GGX09482.1 hypothetical protein GCM10010353_26130 [Streptomyces chryseus]GHB06025.1 hypothetical protein GCM10010346_31550 [Streptomyces chryseus]
MSDAGSTAPPPCRELTWSTTTRQLTGVCPLSLATTFRYRPQEPFTARIDFRLPQAPTVTWCLDRDMLMAGTQSPTGIGDVRIGPAPSPHHADLVLLHLGTPEENATVSIERKPLVHWLHTTYAQVPAGSESEHLDWQPFRDALAG